MTDESFGDPRLAALYDPLDPDRGDLDAYLRMTEEFGARRVLDIGCGTGVFALLPAGRGIEVTGVEPARASLDVARAKPGAARVRWIDGDATALPELAVDLVTMTANVAQAIAGPDAWHGTLRGARAALRPGGGWCSRPVIRPGGRGRDGTARSRTAGRTYPASARSRTGTG